MKAYRVTVKVRNNKLLRAIEKAGYKPGQKFADAVGIGYARLNDFINMTSSPIYKNGDGVLNSVEKLMSFLQTPFEELFTPDQCYALSTNKSEKDIDAEQVYALINGGTSQIEHDEGLSGVLNTAMQSLTQREQEVIKMRFYEDVPLAEIAKHFDVSSERVRQIEKNAFMKIRMNKSCGHALLEFIS